MRSVAIGGGSITEEQRQVVADNHNLIYAFLWKYNLSIDEFYRAAAVGLCQAGATWDASKSKFSTYAFICMYGTVMTEIRRSKSQRVIPSEQICSYQVDFVNDAGDTWTLLDTLSMGDDMTDSAEVNTVWSEYYKTLSDGDKRVLHYKIAGYTQRQLAELMGCSQPHVGRLLKRIREGFVQRLHEE